jgi:anaerobic magnesium-protoporphyrin IX monomethyl ester cyclase
MSEQNICLISSPKRSGAQVIPIALVYLSSWLEKAGIKTDIIDIKSNPYKLFDTSEECRITQEITRRIRIRNPSFVGISCFTPEYNSVMRLARTIKDNSNAKIVVGGVHPTLCPGDFIYKNSPVDFAVMGEGEVTITELVRSSLDNASLKDIRGIAFLENGNMHVTPPRELIDDLGKLPMPSYDKLDMNYYLTVTRFIIRYMYTSGVHILTSRGCPYLCTFCAAKNLWKTPDLKAKVRYKTIKQIVDEVQYLKDRYSIDSFYIADDTFAMSRERAMGFSDELLARNIDIIWAMETRVNLVNEELLKAIKRAGCIQIEFGVESGSQEALDRMKKNIRVEDTLRVFDLCRKYGFRTFANLMLNTPGETEEDVRKTFRLKKRIKASHTGVNLTAPIIGTDAYEEYVRPKLTKEEYYLFEDPHLYTKIVDPRFRLATHNLNLDRLYYIANFYNYLNSFIEFSLNPKYLKSIITSKRKGQIIPSILLNLWKQIKSYGRFMQNVLLAKFGKINYLGSGSKDKKYA